MPTTKTIVAIVHRDRYYWPKLRITVAARVASPTAAKAYIAGKLMASFEKLNCRGRFPRIPVYDYRIVDEAGLKRLYAAAKASATVRRKRGAKKAAVTRARNRAAQQAPRR